MISNKQRSSAQKVTVTPSPLQWEAEFQGPNFWLKMYVINTQMIKKYVVHAQKN